MHELTIVWNIMKIAEEQVIKHNCAVVESIDLDIGDLAGIEMEAFLFAWKSALGGTVLENAQLKINQIGALAKCNECNQQFELEDLYEVCPNCNGFSHALLRGKELKVSSLTLS